MDNNESTSVSLLAAALLLAASATATVAVPASAQSGEAPAVAVPTATSVQWLPRVPFSAGTLTVGGPEGVVLQRSFLAGETVGVALSEVPLRPTPDGTYTWELRLAPIVDDATRAELAMARTTGDDSVVPRLRREGRLPRSEAVVSGTFMVADGLIVPQDGVEPPRTPPEVLAGRASGSAITPLDVVHADDAIITGSMCIGFDCLTDGTENFGFDTLKLKENNLQLYFDDTSSTAGFPANDWRIVANDSSSGGASYLAIEDSTGAKVPFKIAAGARTSALFISSTGRIGIGTSLPVLDIHVVRGDTPSLRLDQDTSSGWTAQTWDLAGNESNFFLRDVTGGSKLPFRVQPGTPTNTLTLKSDGRVGVGTWSPSSDLEVSRTALDSTVMVTRTDGAQGVLVAREGDVRVGSLSTSPLQLTTDGIDRVTIGTDGNITLAGRVDGRDISADGANLDDLTTTVDDLTTTLGGLSTRVDGLSTRIDGLTITVGNLTTRVDGLTTTVGNLTTRVDGLAFAVTDLSAKVTSLRSAMAAQQVGVVPAASFVPDPDRRGLTAKVVFAKPYSGSAAYGLTVTPVTSRLSSGITVIAKSGTGFTLFADSVSDVAEVDWQASPVTRTTALAH